MHVTPCTLFTISHVLPSYQVPHPVVARGTLRVVAPLPPDLRALVAELWPEVRILDVYGT